MFRYIILFQHTQNIQIAPKIGSVASGHLRPKIDDIFCPLRAIGFISRTLVAQSSALPWNSGKYPTLSRFSQKSIFVNSRRHPLGYKRGLASEILFCVFLRVVPSFQAISVRNPHHIQLDFLLKSYHCDSKSISGFSRSSFLGNIHESLDYHPRWHRFLWKFGFVFEIGWPSQKSTLS